MDVVCKAFLMTHMYTKFISITGEKKLTFEIENFSKNIFFRPLCKDLLRSD